MEAVVAVILLNWNGINDTADCVASLLKSTYPAVAIYVVDNASGNNEAATLATQFPGINVLAQKENLGFCAGNNVGISKAIQDGAAYIIVLNNDTLVPPEAIEIMLAGFKKLPAAGAISPAILEHPATEKVWFSKAVWQPEKAQFRLSLPQDRYDELKIKEPYLTDFTCGCCLLSSAEVMNKVGLLDERYFAYYDEAEWCKRLEKNGYQSYVVPQSFIYHKVSRSVVGLVSTYLLTRNRLLWMKENLSFSQRMQSFFYLRKEFYWHLLNSWGIVKGEYSKAHSKAFLQGYKDYRNGLFGRWNEKTEKIIFQKK